MILVQIQHPPLIAHRPQDSLEKIMGEETETPRHVVLRGHSFLTTLGPGDVVEVDEHGFATRVVSLAPQSVYEVDLHLPADYLAGPLPDVHPGKTGANALWEEWQKRDDVTITQMTTFMARMTANDTRVNQTVRTHRFVEHVELLRTPGMKIGTQIPDRSSLTKSNTELDPTSITAWRINKV